MVLVVLITINSNQFWLANNIHDSKTHSRAPFADAATIHRSVGDGEYQSVRCREWTAGAPDGRSELIFKSLRYILVGSRRCYCLVAKTKSDYPNRAVELNFKSPLVISPSFNLYLTVMSHIMSMYTNYFFQCMPSHTYFKFIFSPVHFPRTVTPLRVQRRCLCCPNSNAALQSLLRRLGNRKLMNFCFVWGFIRQSSRDS